MLTLKFVKAFFYVEVTVASPRCCLFSWTCSSGHRTVSAGRVMYRV